jgi:hypothetical protein
MSLLLLHSFARGDDVSGGVATDPDVLVAPASSEKRRREEAENSKSRARRRKDPKYSAGA